MMNIKVNGSEVALESEITVNELLNTQDVEMKEYVTVQLNDRILSKEEFKITTVKDGDTVEFLYFMGGGAV